MTEDRSRNSSSSHAAWVLAIAIAGAALAVGALHTISLCAVALVTVSAAVLAWYRTPPMRVRPAATLLLVVGAVLTAYTALQCIPLPSGWLSALAPYNARIWQRALAPLREGGPAWAPISVDPMATRVEVLRGVVYLLTFLAAVRIARTKQGVERLSAAVVITGLALATAALVHTGLGAKRLFGIYEPSPGIDERHIAPLMNPNNLAGYLNVSLCLALGGALMPEPSVPRPILVALALFLGATQLWLASRGGVAAMVMAVFVILLLSRLRRGASRRTSTMSTVSAALAAAGTAMVALGGSRDAANELFDTNTSKLHLLLQMTRMVPAMPIFGCGRGAFESAYPAFRVDTGIMTYTHPENVILQWTIEWGVPVGAIALVAIAIALRPRSMIVRSPLALGAWAALLALAAQNMADLGSEVPGLAMAGVVCAAVVTGGSGGHRAESRLEVWLCRPAFAVAATALGLSVVGLAASTLGHGLHQDRLMLRDAALSSAPQPRPVRSLAREAMLRHPAEPYLPFITGLNAMQSRSESALPWLAAAIERAPGYAQAHLLLGRFLANSSQSQARLEYRIAMEHAPELVSYAMRDARNLIHGYQDAVDLTPTGPSAHAALEQIAETVADVLPSTRTRVDGELQARFSSAAAPAERIAADAVYDLEDRRTAWCEDEQRDQCFDAARRKAGVVQRLSPDRCAGYLLEARALVATDRATAGLTALERVLDRVTDRSQCLKEFALLARHAGDDGRAGTAFENIIAAACDDEQECATNIAWVALQEQNMGRTAKALAHYKRALERVPNDDAILEQAAALARSTGLHLEAAERYERLASLHPQDTRWALAAVAEREAALRGEF